VRVLLNIREGLRKKDQNAKTMMLKLILQLESVELSFDKSVIQIILSEIKFDDLNSIGKLMDVYLLEIRFGDPSWADDLIEY
jgi:hypothetical protein